MQDRPGEEGMKMTMLFLSLSLSDEEPTESTDVFVGHAQPIDQHRLKTIEENVMILFEFFGHFHNVENMFQEISKKQTPGGEIHKGRVLPLSMSTEDSHLSQR